MARYEGVSKSFRTESITKYRLTAINTRWEATQRVLAAKLTRLTHKITTQLYLEAESYTICSFRFRRPVRKLLDALSYTKFYEMGKLFKRLLMGNTRTWKRQTTSLTLTWIQMAWYSHQVLFSKLPTGNDTYRQHKPHFEVHSMALHLFLKTCIFVNKLLTENT
jgi:hypothetical protein